MVENCATQTQVTGNELGEPPSSPLARCSHELARLSGKRRETTRSSSGEELRHAHGRLLEVVSVEREGVEDGVTATRETDE